MNMPDPIIITGAARSGTSMIAEIINTCGAFGGDTGGKHRNNKHGMFENLQVRKLLEKPYLSKIGADPKAQYPLPATSSLWIPRDWRCTVHDIMLDEGYPGSGPWFVKSPKICLIWPVWAYAFPQAKWIIVRRRDEDIIKSCIHTGFMNYYQDESGWQNWLNTHKQKFWEMIEAELNIRMIWPEKLVYGDYGGIMETIDWLGLNWAGSKVHDCIEPKLWKARGGNK